MAGLNFKADETLQRTRTNGAAELLQVGECASYPIKPESQNRRTPKCVPSVERPSHPGARHRPTRALQAPLPSVASTQTPVSDGLTDRKRSDSIWRGKAASATPETLRAMLFFGEKMRNEQTSHISQYQPIWQRLQLLYRSV